MYTGVILYSIIFGMFFISLVLLIVLGAWNKIDLFVNGSSIFFCAVLLLGSAALVIHSYNKIEKAKSAAQMYNREYHLSVTTEDVFYNTEIIDTLISNKGNEK